ncbi:hypothetical protein EX30DRAFT_40895 [Ascodesmis nigricans]|uniref:Uncharacterized protein n=1 Tax=Ascodesmis nigricans TaxID=341454 RepID=A0A4S2MW62_9PEZI|nr:hypothetical protein EX30DRAFT_40895 [Ascodesmis nigricans]
MECPKEAAPSIVEEVHTTDTTVWGAIRAVIESPLLDRFDHPLYDNIRAVTVALLRTHCVFWEYEQRVKENSGALSFDDNRMYRFMIEELKPRLDDVRDFARKCDAAAPDGFRQHRDGDNYGIVQRLRLVLEPFNNLLWYYYISQKRRDGGVYAIFDVFTVKLYQALIERFRFMLHPDNPDEFNDKHFTELVAVFAEQGLSQEYAEANMLMISSDLDRYFTYVREKQGDVTPPGNHSYPIHQHHRERIHLVAKEPQSAAPEPAYSEPAVQAPLPDEGYYGEYPNNTSNQPVRERKRRPYSSLSQNPSDTSPNDPGIDLASYIRLKRQEAAALEVQSDSGIGTSAASAMEYQDAHIGDVEDIRDPGLERDEAREKTRQEAAEKLRQEQEAREFDLKRREQEWRLAAQRQEELEEEERLNERLKQAEENRKMMEKEKLRERAERVEKARADRRAHRDRFGRESGWR